nr:MAG TPA: hypothetical protein [Caudoviricetes sp.]
MGDKGYINEGDVSFLDLLKAAKEGFDKGKESVSNSGNSSYSYNSVARSSSGLILIFPMLISKSVTPDIAAKLSKYVESKGCIMIQLTLTANNIANTKSGIEYIRRFHQNLDIGGSNLSSIIQAMDDYIAQNESTINVPAVRGYFNTLLEALEDLPTLNPTTMNEALPLAVQKMKVTIAEADKLANNISYDYIIGNGLVFEADGDNITSKKVLERPTVKLEPQDVKKMNGGTPIILNVKFYNSDDSKNGTSFIIGIKSKIVGVNSEEIIRRIYNDNSDGKFFFNFMRAFTGETRFFKDFLLGLSTIEDDVNSIRKKGAKGDVWRLLQNRAQIAKNAVRNKDTNIAAAITTVVITQTDADYLYKQYNIDITDPKVATRFMKSYNLLGFIICDDNTESLKIMFDDGDNEFEELSYAMLDKSSSDGDLKKAITLMLKR